MLTATKPLEEIEREAEERRKRAWTRHRQRLAARSGVGLSPEETVALEVESRGALQAELRAINNEERAEVERALFGRVSRRGKGRS